MTLIYVHATFVKHVSVDCTVMPIHTFYTLRLESGSLLAKRIFSTATTVVFFLTTQVVIMMTA